MDGLEEKLSRLLEKEQAMMDLLRDEYKGMPKGELLIKKSCDKYFFYRQIKDASKGIGKNHKLKQKLVRKCVLRNMLAAGEANCRILTKAIEEVRRVSDKEPKHLHRKTYKRIQELFPAEYYAYTEEQREWMSRGFVSNGYNADELKYMTASGIKVRSKSERTIADILAESRIPFRYEAEFIADGESMFPDFTIMRNDGNIVIWEHFGLMDDPDYFKRTCMKVEKYRRAGFVQHSNLICTYESDMASTERLREILNKYMSY